MRKESEKKDEPKSIPPPPYKTPLPFPKKFMKAKLKEEFV